MYLNFEIAIFCLKIHLWFIVSQLFSNIKNFDVFKKARVLSTKPGLLMQPSVPEVFIFEKNLKNEKAKKL